MDHPSYHQQHQQSHDQEGASTAAAGSRNGGNGGGGGSYLCRQSSARWIPTGDQIRILRDLYYNYGVRSPSAEQIQRISAKLRQYGKIEGKNVFYWFQNHKARERQKKRLTADHISASSAANRIGSASVGSYDGGQFANGASLLGEKSFRGCCFPGGGGGDGAETGMGWFGLESAFQVAPWPYHCAVGSQELVTPVAARAIETLPLFPIRAQEEAEEGELHKTFYYAGGGAGIGQEENYIGYHRHQRSGGGGTSLELTLNSCYYEPPSSM